VAIAGAIVVGLAPAGAQAPAATPDAATVAAAIEQSGWYADPSADPGPDELSPLAAWVAANPHPIAYAVVANEPPASSQSYAYDVLDALPVSSRFQTVVVLSPGDIGIDSDYWDDAAIDQTIDASLDAIRADHGAGLAQLTADLVNRPATTPGTGYVPGRADSYDPYGDPYDDAASGGTASDGGDFTLPVIIVGLVVAALVISWLARGEQYERWGDDDEPYWDRRHRYQRYTSRSSSSSGGWRSSSSSSSSGHSHRGSGGRRL
jgi:uncharacterized membrane protein YgcG